MLIVGLTAEPRRSWYLGSVALGLRLRRCLHGGGEAQVDEVTCGGSSHLTCKRDHIKMRDYTNRQRVTSPTAGDPHLHVNRTLDTLL